MGPKISSPNPEVFLDRFINLERSNTVPYPRKLERMHRLLEACGRPDRSGYRIITVAGTKGKGSTSAMMASILRSAGFKTGLYTSPHLESWNERISVDGAPITETEASDIAGWLEERMERASFEDGLPTYFEVMTAMALVHFARSGCGVSVLEVGLGGEFDAVNACDPDVTVITPIGHDHERVLGSTLAEIARAKAGIIKEGVPVVSSPQPREAMDVIEETARARRAPLYRVGESVRVEPVVFSKTSQTFIIDSASGKQGPFELPLVGQHQAENAAAAWLALRIFAERTGNSLDPLKVAEGFGRVRWPGRMELALAEPCVLLDGAHTPESARALEQAVRRHFHYDRFEMILGMMSDKNPEGFMDPFRSEVDLVRVVPIAHERAFTAAELAARVKAMGVNVLAHDSVETAIGAARAAAGPARGRLILVTGSLYLVGHARRILGCGR